MRNVAIYETASGRVVATRSAEDVGTAPSGYGLIDYDPATDPRGWRVVAGALVPDVLPETPSAAMDRMLTVIDEERESRMMAQLTAGGAKKYEYAAKLREWQDFNTLTLSSVLAMTLGAQQARWPWAMAEAADSGDTLQVVMARYKAGMDNSALARKIAARAQTLKRKLKAAPPADRASLFNSRTWPTS